MIIDYFPIKMDEVYEFIQDECEYKGNRDVKEIIYDLLSDNFCKYINKKGKNEGSMCLRRFRINENYNEKYCYFHRYREKKCYFNNCNKKCKVGYNKCNKHFKYITKIENYKETFIYYSDEEGKEINLFNNIDIESNNIELYPSVYFNYKLKNNEKEICNEKALQRNVFTLNSFLSSVYIIYKDLFIILKRYNINIQFLYNFLKFLKDIFSSRINIDNNKSYHHYIYNNTNIIEIPKNYNKNNMEVILYNLYGYEITNLIIKEKIKKYKKLQKNKNKRKRQKEKRKPNLEIVEKVINVNILNNKDIIENIDLGYMGIKKWPLHRDLYKHLVNEEIIYFHNYYYNDKNSTKVIIFYKRDGVFNSEKITYNHLYELLNIKFNSNSINDYINSFRK